MHIVGGHGAFSSRVKVVARSRAFAGLAVGVLLGTLLVSVAAEQPAAAYGPSYCSGYRWNVKTGQDPQASQVNLGSVTPTTVGYLTSLPAHKSLPDNYRLPPTELTQYEITGKIVNYGIEQHDQDYHVVIQDNSSKNVMITEFPNPACVPSSSPFAAMAANARNTLIAHAKIGATVAIKGPGFFDSNTLTSNVAPNKIELHPVLDINFNPGSTNDFSMSASPTSESVAAGNSASSTISTVVSSGVAQSVGLTASGLPSGAAASFAPSTINSGANSTMNITTSSTTPVGSYPITVTGTGTSATHSTTFTLTVTPASTTAPQLVQSAGSSTKKVTLTAPSKAGDLLVLNAGLWTGTAKRITAVSDGRNRWVKIRATAVSGQKSDGEMWYAANAAAVSSVTVTTGASTVALNLQEYSGVAASSPLDGSNGAAGDGTSATSGPVTPTGSNDLAVGFIAGHGNSESISLTSPGFTSLPQQTTTSPNLVSVESGYQDLASTATQSFSGDYPTIQYWSSGIVLLKAGA